MAALLTASHPAWQALEGSSVAAAQTPSEPTQLSPAKSDPIWQKRWWIEKTARLLRGGDGLGPNDDIDALLKLPEEEIVRRFMNDPRFGDTILDFNMYYLGFKVDELKEH